MSTTTETGAVLHVAPGALLLERNIRDCQPITELIESVRALGVLEPITAVSKPDGALVVRFGHRRALAAVAAGLDSVPVYVAGADWTDDDAEVDRIIRQRDENTHRTGLTAAEEVGVVEQLAAFGLTADQISAKARIARPAVDAAVTVSGSKLTRKAAERYEALTLDQAAAVAEFEDDPETFKALVVTAIDNPAQFAHRLQRQRDDREQARLTAEARDRLTAEGITVLDETPEYGSKAKALYSLVDNKSGKELTEARHRKCPGHACTIRIGSNNQAVPFWYCTDPFANGHRDKYNSSGTIKKPAAEMSDKEREAARKARALVIENNKAWDSATAVRLGWLRDLAKHKAAPKGTAAFIATALATDRQALTDYRVTGVVADLLGAQGPGHLDTHVLRLLKGASETRAQLVALVQVLGSLEATLTQQSWRGNGTNSTAGRYLRFLEACDYPLSDVEKFAISGRIA